MALDPVCGMTVDEKNAAAISEYDGTTIYFCAEACKKKFEANPDEYLNSSREAEMPDGDAEKSDVVVMPTGEMAVKDQSKLIVPIQGMSCASCIENIEKGLRGVEGVIQASVNFGTEKATVVFDPERVSPDRLVETIKEVGYTPVVEKAVLPITGMSCASCVQKIETTL
ncbi:MAG: cation transporter, partial [bacterium]